jgi:alanine racemase
VVVPSPNVDILRDTMSQPQIHPSFTRDRLRPTWAEVDLGAVRHNVAALVAVAAPADLCAVVKADAYGHGAVPVARAALDAGARWLAVALVEEAIVLRQSGISAPILLLSEPPPDAFDAIAAADIIATVYTLAGVQAAAKAARGRGSGRPLRIHLKVDTGMHRVGISGDELSAVATAVTDSPLLQLDGLFTHFACADDPTSDYTATQIEQFDAARQMLAAVGIRPRVVHAANSAALLAYPGARYDMVRAGIAVYGYPPSPALAGIVPLRPVLSLHSRVGFVKTVEAGDGVSYGQHFHPDDRRLIATAPIGYADGVRRCLAASGATVLIGGEHRSLAGTVTMDQITIDCGPASAGTVRAGDEVVLLGSQGQASVTAQDWADRTGTITYEVLCGISSRVPRCVRDATAVSTP